MKILRILLFPLSILYALIVYSRNFLYDIGVFESRKFETPTICVGNLSVGGTGKTPMIEFIIRAFEEKNSIAVLSRGYKRKSAGYQDSKNTASVEILGDEPFQIASKFPNVIVAVDADRQNGIRQLEKEELVDFILLDDAFQHRKVHPDFSILLTAYSDLYSQDWYLPTGNLRDSKREAKRADIIVVTKCPENLSKNDQEKVILQLKPNANQKVLFSYLFYQKHLMGSDGNLQLFDLKDKAVTLVTGIANPKPLLGFLKENGIVVEHLTFSDHHFFTDSEIASFNTKEIILTTEKDFVRLQNKVKNLYYIAIEHKFFDQGSETLKQSINSILKQ